MSQRRAVTKATAVRYRSGTKTAKAAILDELGELTGWHRNHARKALRRALGPKRVQVPRRARPPLYGEEVMVALRKVWAVMDAPAGKRMAPFLPEITAALERAGELDLTPAVRAQLVGMSAATIDRRLAPDRAKLRIRGRSGTKPGSLLKSQIPIPLRDGALRLLPSRPRGQCATHAGEAPEASPSVGEQRSRPALLLLVPCEGEQR